uniref:Uncharacterized protein n=1 Tax=Triticum urartu TaxID=4572 RepID=A0A8R7QKY3_TRIUA
MQIHHPLPLPSPPLSLSPRCLVSPSPSLLLPCFFTKKETTTPKTSERAAREEKNRGLAAAMASGGGPMTKKELGETHDVLRFGVNDSVRGDLAPAHPVQATIHKEAKFWDEKKKFGTEAIYGSAFNIRRDLDAHILSRR